MVWVTYHCPYCGAVTGVDRDAYLNDKCVTREPPDGWTDAATTDDDVEAADGIEFVCLGDGVDDDDDGSSSAANDGNAGGANDPQVGKDGCGRTFYRNYVKYADGEEVDHRTPDIDRPRFDFSP